MRNRDISKTGSWDILIEGDNTLKVTIGTYSFESCWDGYDFGNPAPPSDPYARQSSDQNTEKKSASDIITALNGEENNQMYTIYPNPATNEITVKNPNVLLPEQQEIRIYNMLNQVMVESKINSNEVRVNVDSLESGIYIVQIKSSKGIFKQRLVIK